MTKEESQKKRRTVVRNVVLATLGLALAVEAGRLTASKEARERLVGYGKKGVDYVKGLFTKKHTATTTVQAENRNRNQYYGYKKPRFNN